jgi:hypothetical protein
MLMYVIAAVEGRALADVQDILREFAANIEVSASSGSSSSSSSSSNNTGDEKAIQTTESVRQRKVLIEWSACLQHILQQRPGIQS